MRYRWVFRSIGAVVFAAAAIWIVHFLLFTRSGVRLTHTNVRQLSEYLQSLGAWSYVLGTGAVLLQTVLPIVPFVVVAGANVLAFGLFYGFLINYGMACAGAVLTFLFARYVGHDWVEGKLSRYPMTVQWNRNLERSGFFYVLVGRLIPVIPSSIINLGSGVTKVRFKHYFLGTLIGNLPIVLLESFIGNDLLHIRHNRGRLVVLLIVFVALMVLGAWIKRRLAKKPPI